MLLFTTDRNGPAAKSGSRPATRARMGSWPSSQWLGRPSGPAQHPARAQTSPRGRQSTAAVDRQIDGRKTTRLDRGVFKAGATLENPRTFIFFPYLPSPEEQRRQRVFFPAAGALAGGGGELRRPVLDRDELPLPVPLTPASLSLKSTKKRFSENQSRDSSTMEGGGATVGPLAGARVHPMGERAAVERPGGGAQTHTPHTDDAAASSCSSSPARRRVNPHRGGGPCG
jgi:hypothetical protein